MYKILLSLITLTLTFGSLQAQFFNISNIETEEFPWVSTIFVAKDGDNEFIKNATIDQFTIEEEGIFIPNNDTRMRIDCFESQDVPELSIVIVVDRSQSMLTPFDETKPNETPWQKVQLGVEAFLKTIKFVGRTQASLVAFSNNSLLGCPFTSNPDDILDSLKNIKPSGSTRYDPPYIKPEYLDGNDTIRESAVTLLKTRPADMKRIVVFLTDGAPSQDPRTQEIIDSLNNYNISAYNISFLTSMDPSLYEIAIQTNGNAYLVEKKEDLEQIYTQIAIEAQKAYFCRLSWLADYPCYDSQREREVNITFKGISPFGRGNRSYLIPEIYVPVRTWENKTYSFGNPEVGANNSVIKTLKLIIGKVDFDLNKLELVPDNQGFKILSKKDIDGNDISDNSIISEGDTLFIEVEFEQFGSKTLRTATLTANGSPCLTAAELVGGTTDIILETPIGGEVFTTCDDININWNGVEPGTQVHVSYSKDDFKQDSSFIATSTNKNYSWTTPPNTPGKYKVKLRVDPVARYVFALNDKGSNRSHGSSIELSRDELFIYSCGNYNDTVKFENTVLSNPGNMDMFLAKHNTAGKLIWANSMGGDGLDSAAGVCVDDQEQVFITGATSKGAKFGTATASASLGGSVFFVAKTNSNGGVYQVRTIAAKNPYTNFEAWGTSIRYDEITETIIVRGEFKNDLEYTFGQVSHSFNNGGRFTAFYDKNLNLLRIDPGYIAGNYSDDEEITDDSKSTYKIGTMSNDRTFGSFNVKHNGGNDFYITRFGFNEPSTSISNSTFTIEKPTLEYSKSGPIQFNDTPIEGSDLKNINEFVLNKSILPIEVESVTITGPNKDDFNIDKTFDGLIVSDKGKDISLNFSPKTVGIKTATLNIKGVCADVISIELTGIGICDLSVTETINFGASNLSISSLRTDNKVFINNNKVAIRVTPQIINDNENEFNIISINGNTGLVGNSLTVDPEESIEVELSFTPKTEGNKTAQLAFKPETIGCADIVTNLTGTGANTDLAYAIVDFGRKRIKTVSTINLEITNAGALDVELADVYLDNTDAFSLDLPDPLLVEKGGSLIIGITFNPQLDGIYSEPINIVINQGDSPISLNNVIGIGENPTAIGSLDCKSGGIQNTTTLVDLILDNNSKVAVTEIQTITISPTSNYTFVGGSKSLPIVNNIAIDNILTIFLEFTPTLPGINNLDLTIISNTAVGNDIDENVNDPLTSNITLSCSALPNTGAQNVIFKGVLVCDTYTKNYTILNQDASNVRSVESYTITPSGTDYTTNLPNNSFDIQPTGNYPFEITFSPLSVGTQNANLIINFSDGVSEEYIIEGTGKRIRFYTNKPDIDVVPGSETKLTVMAEIPLLDYPIDNMNIKIKHNPEVTSFNTDNNGKVKVPISNSVNWTWDNLSNINSSEYLDFTGTADPSAELTEGTYELFEIEYIMYLGPTKIDNLQVANYFENCQNNEFNSIQKVNLSGVCALDKRLIQIGILPEASITTFNGNINMVRTEFTVMYDNLPVNIEIIDINGNRVASKYLNNLSQGRYESVLDANDISSGLYFVRVNSGSISDSQKLLIVK